mmetsp:Transcript_42775/g.62428  ORF Transcript_42775/g.62428 Transcript_42775/m.62428 type:complete len:684 (-) Transcript_42775:436-2487(-)
MPSNAIDFDDISKADSFDVAIEAATSNGSLTASVAVGALHSSDATVAAALQAMEQLVEVFGFSPSLASDAVDVVGPDVTAAYNYILDGGKGEDKGGPVVPKADCPHLKDHVKVRLDDVCLGRHCSHYSDVGEDSFSSRRGGFKSEIAYEDDDGEGVNGGKPRKTCPSRENWICLDCNVSRCSRYVNGHALAHWEDTKAKEVALLAKNESDSLSDAEVNSGGNAVNDRVSENEASCVAAAAGHCVWVSVSDLSVWCYECNAYLKHPKLDPLLKRLEELKFPSTTSSSEDERQAGHSAASDRRYDSEGVENDEYAEEGSEYSSDDSVAAEAAEAEREASLMWESHPPPPLPESLEEMARFILSPRCKSIAILAGAGMSVASGIPDFRSAGFGMYDTLQPELLTATEVEREAIRVDPTTVFEKNMFIQNQLPCLELKRPFILGTHGRTWKATLAHRFVELLHKKTGKLTRLYTQNIDGLEGQCADLPRDKVVDVHGSMGQAHCEICDSPHGFDWFCSAVRSQIKDVTGQDPNAPEVSTPIPCRVCGQNTVKPTIVLFRSNLPIEFFERIRTDLPSVDLLLIVGTSLTVAPANSLVYKVPHSALRMVVNNEPVGTRLGIRYGEESTRDFFGQGKCDEVFLELMLHLGWIDELKGLADDLPEESAKTLRDRLASANTSGCADDVLSDG